MSRLYRDHGPFTLAVSTRGYKASVLSIHDGDTLNVEVDLGRRTYLKDQYLGFTTYIHDGNIVTRVTLRLYGINCPELPTAAGVAAGQYLDSLIGASLVTVVPYVAAGHHAKDKYGRWLADVRVGEPGSTGVWVNDAMVKSGHAVPYFGGPR